MLATPGGFRHLHLNSVDPDAAIDFYTRQFPPTTRTRWGDLPVLASPNDVLPHRATRVGDKRPPLRIPSLRPGTARFTGANVSVGTGRACEGVAL